MENIGSDKRFYQSSLFRSAGIYTLSNILSAAIPFLMLPILTRYLSPSDYGVVSMFQVVTSIAAPFIGLSMHGAIGRQYMEKDIIDLPKYITNCLFLLLTSTIIMGSIICIFAGPISEISSFQKNWLWSIAIFSFGQFMLQILLVLWQMEGKAIYYAFFCISQTLCNVGLSLWLIIGFGLGWQGRISGQVISTLIFGLIALGVLWRSGWIRFSYDKAYIYNALSFGIPLIPHALGGWATSMIDRVFITNVVGISATGIYSVGCQIGMIISILESSFIQAWVPIFYEKLKINTQENKIKIVRFTYIYFVGLISIALALSFLAPWFMNIFIGKQFEGAHKYVIWIALGYAANGMYKMMAGYIFYIQKTSVLAQVTVIGGVLSILITYILTKLYGAMGAAYATSLNFAIAFILTWILSNRLYKMPWFDFSIITINK